jgi:hypothetical protein
MTVVVPGQGDATTEDVQQLRGDSMQVAVSNTVGAWAKHFAVTDLDRFGAMIDRVGGISADLPDVSSFGGEVLGPGQTHLTGAQTIAVLKQRSDNAAERWDAVLQGFLAATPQVTPGDLTDTDDAAGTAALLRAAAGAAVSPVPTQEVGGTVTIAAEPELDQLVSGLFGSPTPIRSLIQNGNGSPGVGEAVARLILPEGFRVVLSQNAPSFDHTTTDVVAMGPAHVGDARRARAALGVGTVEVAQVPSGLADVTIVVGKDFQG